MVALLKAAYNISTAWDKVEFSTLKKALNGILKPETQPDISQPFHLEIEQFMSVLGALKLNVTSSEVEAWFQGDGPGYEHLDENAIVDMVTVDDLKEEEEDDEDEPSGTPRVTNTEAMECTGYAIALDSHDAKRKSSNCIDVNKLTRTSC